MLFVLFALAALITTITTVLVEQAWKRISVRYIHDATRRVATEFQNTIADVEASLVMVQEWGSTGLLDPAETEQSKGLLFPFFGKNEMLAGISISGTEDQGFFMLRDGEVIIPSEQQYDPADRPWFAPALRVDGCSWTGVYAFHTLDRLGITASIAWNANNGEARSVVAFDILLEDFLAKTQSLAPTPASKAYVFMPDGRLYIPESETNRPEFKSIAGVKAIGA